MGSLHRLNARPTSSNGVGSDERLAGSPLLSIVVPAKDEAENLPALTGRIRQALAGVVDYELVIVDDQSTDGTAAVAAELGRHHPVIVVVRRNAVSGKGYALLDGFARGLGPIVCMIDADLQYPPEAIPEMVAKIRAGADVVVANRVRHHTGALRRVVSRASYGFVQALYALDVDVQSGLKVIRREVLDRIHVRPSGWAIDLDILMSAKATGHRIVGHDIEFDRRQHGETKVRLVRTTWQIARRAIALKVAALRDDAGRPRDAVPIRAPRRVGVEPPAQPAA